MFFIMCLFMCVYIDGFVKFVVMFFLFFVLFWLLMLLEGEFGLFFLLIIVMLLEDSLEELDRVEIVFVEWDILNDFNKFFVEFCFDFLFLDNERCVENLLIVDDLSGLIFDIFVFLLE